MDARRLISWNLGDTLGCIVFGGSAATGRAAQAAGEEVAGEEDAGEEGGNGSGIFAGAGGKLIDTLSPADAVTLKSCTKKLL